MVGDVDWMTMEMLMIVHSTVVVGVKKNIVRFCFSMLLVPFSVQS